MNAMDRLEAAVRAWRGFQDWHGGEWRTALVGMGNDMATAAEAVVAERVRADDSEVEWIRRWMAPFPKDTRERFYRLLDRLVGPAPWQPAKGEKVRGYRAGCTVDGPYFSIGWSNGPAHRLGHLGEIEVENIEPLDGRTP